MQFGCSIEMVNMLSSSQNFFNKFSKSYWLTLFKHMAATGFKGIELAYNPYSSDPMAFEIGRCGVPISRFAINAKYGSVSEFMKMLRDFGIDEVSSVHIKAGDTLLELTSTEKDAGNLFEEFIKLAKEAIDFACEIGAKGLVISPTPEIGWLEKHFNISNAEAEEQYIVKTIEMMNDIIKIASEKNIEIAVRNEYWSLFRGNGIERLMSSIDSSCLYSPDLAHLEIAHCSAEEMISKYSKKLGYIVFSDSEFVDSYDNYKKINAEIPVKGPQRVFCDLGCGKVDLKGIYKKLQDLQYDNWIICDNKKTLDVQKALLDTRWYIDHEILGA